MDAVRESNVHSALTGTFVEGEVQGEFDDACSICLEEFSQSEPATVTDCKHEFHLHCILEWCHRCSNCPLCWQPVSLKDGPRVSQQLLESIEHEKSLRATRSRIRTAFHHPTLENLEVHTVQLPMDVSEVDLEEHIFHHLAAAASTRSGHLFRREGQRSGPSSQGQHPFFVFSAPNAPRDASVLTSLNPVGGGSHSVSVSLGSAPILGRSSPEVPVSISLSPPQTDEGFAHRVGYNFASASRQRIVFETRQPYHGNQSTAEPSDLQSLSESLRSRFNAWSMRYKESISRNTRGFKERLFARNPSMANLGSEVRRELDSGIAGLSRLMERLERRVNNGSGHASRSSYACRSTRNSN